MRSGSNMPDSIIAVSTLFIGCKIGLMPSKASWPTETRPARTASRYHRMARAQSTSPSDRVRVRLLPGPARAISAATRKGAQGEVAPGHPSAPREKSPFGRIRSTVRKTTCPPRSCHCALIRAAKAWARPRIMPPAMLPLRLGLDHLRHPAEDWPVLRGGGSFSHSVALLIESMSADDPVQLAALARVTGLSPRSVQRALTAEGTCFRTLTCSLRRSRALDALKDGARPFSLISAGLGYTSQSSFSRAVRRWTGEPPGGVTEGQRKPQQQGGRLPPL